MLPASSESLSQRTTNPHAEFVNPFSFEPGIFDFSDMDLEDDFTVSTGDSGAGSTTSTTTSLGASSDGSVDAGGSCARGDRF